MQNNRCESILFGNLRKCHIRVLRLYEIPCANQWRGKVWRDTITWCNRTCSNERRISVTPQKFSKVNRRSLCRIPCMADAVWWTSTICRSKLCSHFPFIHLLPNSMYNSLLKLCKEEDGTISELMSIKECRTSIELFEKLIKRCAFSVVDKKFWFINPHYKQKFKLTPSLLPR